MAILARILVVVKVLGGNAGVDAVGLGVLLGPFASVEGSWKGMLA